MIVVYYDIGLILHLVTHITYFAHMIVVHFEIDFAYFSHIILVYSEIDFIEHLPFNFALLDVAFAP